MEQKNNTKMTCKKGHFLVDGRVKDQLSSEWFCPICRGDTLGPRDSFPDDPDYLASIDRDLIRGMR